MTPDAYRRHDATGLAALVARGEVSAVELSEASLAAIDAGEASFNAIAVDDRERGRERARGTLSGPFAGVPFLLKDIFQPMTGLRMTLGVTAMRDYLPKRQAHYVDRCLDAGFVVLGSTTAPELGLKATTETRLHGATRNPWDTEVTPGGSSGGAAAAVAAGYVPLAAATDGGGSIRIPAAYCGLFGLKPSRGRVSDGPDSGERWDGALAAHALTRSVRDSAAFLDAVAGAAPDDPFAIPPPERPFRDEVGRDPGRLRIGFSARSPVGGRVAPEMVDAVERTARLLGDLGHHVEPAEPAIDGRLLARCYMGMYFGQTAAAVAWVRRQTGAREDGFDLDTRAVALLGRALTAQAYVEFRQQWSGFAGALGEFFGRYDLHLSPTTALGPARIGELDTPRLQRSLARLAIGLRGGRLLLRSGIVDDLAFRNLERTPFTQAANLAGVPAMSVPLHHDRRGLPVGVQVTARFGAEDLLFRLAGQLEQAAPWAGRRPPAAAPG